MRKTIGFLVILGICVGIGQAESAICPRGHHYNPNELAVVTGKVVAVGRNFIEVYDEDQKRLKRFVYFERGEGFHQGDYVRVYDDLQGGPVRINRMTVLTYKKNGQNLGYISR